MNDPVRIAHLVLRRAINMHRLSEYVREHCDGVVIGQRKTDNMDEPMQKLLDAGWVLEETVHIGPKRIRTLRAPEKKT